MACKVSEGERDLVSATEQGSDDKRDEGIEGHMWLLVLVLRKCLMCGRKERKEHVHVVRVRVIVAVVAVAVVTTQACFVFVDMLVLY